ncbi:MAG: acyltransferase family protein, partial [Clostridia bacterium]|nr:acyltransferase family protein [Clostridia bacterium]
MQRNNGLDLLKTICAFMIICVHAPFPGLLGDIFTPLARIAVPVFFMITGYYYSLTKERKKEKKQIIKVLKLFLSANVLYVFWSLVKVVMNGDSITAFIGDVFSIKTILGFLV